MTFNASSSNEDGYDAELYPNVAAVAAVYGDPDGKYAQWLAGRDNTFPSQPYFLWDQPLSNAGLSAPSSTSTAGASPSGVGSNTSSAWGLTNGRVGLSCLLGLVVFVALISF